jgi:hypothetical protein
MKKRILLNSLLFATALSSGLSQAAAQWNKVGPVGGPGFNVFALRAKGTDLYAGGTGIAKWDGTAWTSLGRVAPSSSLGMGSLGINTMVVFNDTLYVAGDIDSIGGVYIGLSVGVAKYNGTTWEPVGTSSPDLSGVTTLAVYHNQLYASGNYGVNRWDGSSWTSIGTVNGPANVVIAVYHDELYAASSFSRIGTANMTIGKGFAKWDGTTWTALPGFFDTLSVLPGINVAKVNAMTVFKDELFVVGALDYAGTTYTRGAARWNGTSWRGTNGGLTGNGTPVSNCVCIDSSNLYLVGPFQKVNTTNDSIYLSTYWDGSKWNPMFGGNAPYTSFFASENFNGRIYSAYNSLVRWDAPTAVPMAEIAENNTNIFPVPSQGLIHVVLNWNTISSITVRNVVGAVVYSGPGYPGKNLIDLRSAANGMYFVEITDNTKTETKKILIQK